MGGCRRGRLAERPYTACPAQRICSANSFGFCDLNGISPRRSWGRGVAIIATRSAGSSAASRPSPSTACSNSPMGYRFRLPTYGSSFPSKRSFPGKRSRPGTSNDFVDPPVNAVPGLAPSRNYLQEFVKKIRHLCVVAVLLFLLSPPGKRSLKIMRRASAKRVNRWKGNQIGDISCTAKGRDWRGFLQRSQHPGIFTAIRQGFFPGTCLGSFYMLAVMRMTRIPANKTVLNKPS